MRDLPAHSQKHHPLEIGGRAARIKERKKLICVEGESKIKYTRKFLYGAKLCDFRG